MRISWNWLSELVDLTPVSGVAALAELLTQRGLEVEGIEPQAKGFEKIVTAQILEKAPHPQADRLSLCRVSTGSGEALEIVCGAQNMKVGDRVALAQIGARIPNGLEIARSKIRGVISNGMLCAEKELGLSEESEGILILPPSTPLGAPLAKVLGLGDTLFFLKLTANRGDCFSHFGIAREIAAALEQSVKKPPAMKLPTGSIPIKIELNADKLAPQFYGCLIEGVKIGPSPEWMVKRLEILGHRSINNVVDATNYVLMELGHPTHAYDSKQIRGQKIQVRLGKAGESLPLLDGETVQLQGGELVIADAERPIGLAGIMGGGNSEVQEGTQSLFLECAEFDPVLVRRTASKYQKRTEAAQRFEKGVDPKGLEYVMARLATLITELAGGKVVGASNARLPSRLEQWKPREIRFEPYYVSEFLGFGHGDTKLKSDRIEKTLRTLNCEVQRGEKSWKVIPPSYRLDLSTREDIAEEVARSVGYDTIPSTIPPLSSSPVFSKSSLSEFVLMDRAKESLIKNGLLETLNYSFTSQAWLKKLGMTSKIKVMNPLSAEFEWMVPSLLPGLVQNAMENWNHHFGSEPLAIRLFEIRPAFVAGSEIKAQGKTETGVTEEWKVSWLLSGPRYSEALKSDLGEVDFYDLKGGIDSLLAALGTKGARYQPIRDQPSRWSELRSLFHPGQSAELWAGGSLAGYFGLLHPAKERDIKARSSLWMAELDWNILKSLSRAAEERPRFRAWPEFPPIERDFALLVRENVSVEKICQVALKAGKPLAKKVKVFDIYRGSQVAEGMTSVAVRVIFYEESRSLQETEAENASAQILNSWNKELGAELRG